MLFFADSTELPSRRAGGAFGHSVRVVLPQTGVVANSLRLSAVCVNRSLLSVVASNKPLLRREHADAARAGQAMNILFARNKARSMINERFAVARIVRFSFKAFAGFLNTMLFFADSTRLPSRRAGGAFGHSE